MKRLILFLLGIGLIIWLISSSSNGFVVERIEGTEDAYPYSMGISMSEDGSRLVYVSSLRDPSSDILFQKLSTIDLQSNKVVNHRLPKKLEGRRGEIKTYVDHRIEIAVFKNKWLGNKFFIEIYGERFVLDFSSSYIPTEEEVSDANCSDCPDMNLLREVVSDYEKRFDLELGKIGWYNVKERPVSGARFSMARNVNLSLDLYCAYGGTIWKFNKDGKINLLEKPSRLNGEDIELIKVSPDGRYLAVVSVLRHNLWFPLPQIGERLYVINLLDGSLKFVQEFERIGGVVWSPDSKGFYLTAFDELNGVYRVIID